MSVRLPVSDLIDVTGGHLMVPEGAPAPTQIVGVTTDSRTATPGCLFVALRGPRTDGHRFVGDAAERGAALVVVADPSAACGGPALVVTDTLRALGAVAGLYRRSLPVTIAGITGSVGKTTTVGMCGALLEQRFVTARSAESWNAEIGVAMTLLGLEPSHEVAVMELAMRGLGQLRELVELARPRIGAVTTIGETHLELLGSMEHIAAAKAELVEGLPGDGVAIVNADETWTPRLVRGARCRVVRFGTVPDADVRATAIASSAGGCRFVLRLGARVGDVQMPVVGAHHVRNALVAAAVGDALGLSFVEIVTGLARVRVPKMRQQILTIDDVMLIDDSYNASPQSMAAVMDVMRQVGGARRRIMALGEMLELGPRSMAFHHEVGAWAATMGPVFLLAVGPNARWYLEGATASGFPARATAWAPTPQEAIPLLTAVVRPGDVVLVKGSRGIEMEHVVAALAKAAPVGH